MRVVSFCLRALMAILLSFPSSLGCASRESSAFQPSRPVASTTDPEPKDEVATTRTVPTSIEASAFVLLDKSGRRRGGLEVDGETGAPALSLLSEDGLPLFVARLDKAGAMLSVTDSKKRVQVQIDGVSIRIVDQDGLALVRLAFETSGGAESSSVSIQSGDGAPFVSLSAIRGGPATLILSGADGKGNAILTIENGAPTIHLRDDQGETVLKAPE